MIGSRIVRKKSDMPYRPNALLVFALVAATGSAAADDAGLIATMDAPRFQPPKEKGRTEIVAGKFGGATRFQFDKDSSSTFFTSNIHGTADWDRAAGLSFWVKGNGSDGFGGLEFIFDDDYAVRYDLAFPFKAGQWTKVTVAWQDLIAVLPGPRAKPLGISRGNQPSKLSGMWWGRWWYWGDYPASSTSRLTRFASSRKCQGKPRNSAPPAPPWPASSPSSARASPSRSSRSAIR